MDRNGQQLRIADQKRTTTKKIGQKLGGKTDRNGQKKDQKRTGREQTKTFKRKKIVRREDRHRVRHTDGHCNI